MQGLYKNILHTMQVVSNKQQVMPKDLLGRSLAYNCFLPRLSNKAYLYENLKRDRTFKKALYNNVATLDKVIKTNKFETNEIESGDIVCVLFDDSIGCENEKYMDSLDYLSMIRRLSPFFVIHDSVFINEYQILESAIGGADMIVFDTKYLKAYCECVYAFENNSLLLDYNMTDIATYIASNESITKDSAKEATKIHLDKLLESAYILGLVPIVRIQDREDLVLLHALHNFPHCIYTSYDMIDLLPEETIIFVKNDNMNLQNKSIDIMIIDS